ncbi:ferrous iron transport protein A [Vibrio albus]|jgi:ferrous iron transport protein A|uniref:Ferrous iron transport protein A n=1 Tax=Vibrio albus TaxID=2200953 RepID=A0A2U3BAR3_9VIBR|nr:FeoA family protein [Vibrio albus]PWI33886.1 ferrous iron transport protein A [Vibrio albus]
MKLSELNNGNVATVSGFSGLSGEIKKKLMVMGVLPSTEIEVVRRAPMGDPMQIVVRGMSLAVRNSIASQIEVEVK